MWTKQNYYSYTEELLLVHYIPLKYFTPFFKTTIILLSYYQTTILETEKDYSIIYKQQSTFES